MSVQEPPVEIKRYSDITWRNLPQIEAPFFAASLVKKHFSQPLGDQWTTAETERLFRGFQLLSAGQQPNRHKMLAWLVKQIEAGKFVVVLDYSSNPMCPVVQLQEEHWTAVTTLPFGLRREIKRRLEEGRRNKLLNQGLPETEWWKKGGGPSAESEQDKPWTPWTELKPVDIGTSGVSPVVAPAEPPVEQTLPYISDDDLDEMLKGLMPPAVELTQPIAEEPAQPAEPESALANASDNWWEEDGGWIKPDKGPFPVYTYRTEELDATFGESLKHLTKAERDALTFYTGKHYTTINEHFRLGKDADNVHLQEIKNMDSAFSNEAAKLPEDVSLFRGCWHGTLNGWDDLLDSQGQPRDDCAGKELSDSGFCSTSIVKGTNFEQEVIMKIKAPKGTNGLFVAPIAAFDYNRKENEVLLNRGTKFRVDKLQRRPDPTHGTVYELEVTVLPSE
jgi:hypothetical protein